MINEVKGNIFNFIQGDNCYLVHQTNTEGVMGGGIALQIKNLFPNVYKQYTKLCKETDKNDLLGIFQSVQDQLNGKPVTICNCFAQDLSTYYGEGLRKRLTNYDALENSLINLSYILPSNAKILIPKYIGCGIGGGDWNIVYEIIQNAFGHLDVTIVDFNGDKLF